MVLEAFTRFMMMAPKPGSITSVQQSFETQLPSSLANTKWSSGQKMQREVNLLPLMNLRLNLAAPSISDYELCFKGFEVVFWIPKIIPI
jgi:hypothetical protein